MGLQKAQEGLIHSNIDLCLSTYSVRISNTVCFCTLKHIFKYFQTLFLTRLKSLRIQTPFYIYLLTKMLGRLLDLTREFGLEYRNIGIYKYIIVYLQNVLILLNKIIHNV